MSKQAILLVTLVASVGCLLVPHAAAAYRNDYVRASEYSKLYKQLEQVKRDMWHQAQALQYQINQLKLNLPAQIKAEVAVQVQQHVQVGLSAPDLTVNTLTANKVTVANAGGLYVAGDIYASGNMAVSGSVETGHNMKVNGDLNVPTGSITTPTVNTQKVLLSGDHSTSYIEFNYTADPAAPPGTVPASQRWWIRLENPARALVVRDATCGGDMRFAFWPCKNVNV